MIGLAAASLAFSAPAQTVEIAPGVHMPLVGLGTWLYNSSTVEGALTSALKLGYVHVDTAADYGNAAGVAAAIKKSGVKRETLFVTTKIPGGLNLTSATAALDAELKALKLEYVDLMLVHFPASMDAHLSGGKASRQETWRALEGFHKAGKARAIGVSHYCKKHLEDVLAIATVTPALNQVEYHVGMGTASDDGTDDKAWMQSQGVTFMGFSPLCGPCGAANHLELITGALVTSIGKKYNKTGAQVALKWQVQQMIPVIPKSANPEHLQQNLDLFGWELSQDDFAALTQATQPPVTGGGDNKTSGDCGIP